MKDPVWRERARRLLIAKYFEPAERISLYTLVDLPIPNDDEINAADASFTSSIARLARRVARLAFGSRLSREHSDFVGLGSLLEDCLNHLIFKVLPSSRLVIRP